MDYCILRIEKNSMSRMAAMARHALREDEVLNADPAKRHLNTIYGPKTANEVIAEFRRRTEPLMKRRNLVRCLEFLITGSPEKMHALSLDEQNRYFKKSIDWVARNFGGSQNIISAVIHRDETTPHLQLLLVPIDNGVLRAKVFLGGPPGLRKLQTSFAEEVGAEFGFRRGELGSKAKHIDIRKFYAALNQVRAEDGLPSMMPIPKVPPKPLLTFLESDDEKAARLKAEKQREDALAHNRRVQTKIRMFATVGAATHSAQARALPRKMAKNEKLIEENRRLAEETRKLIARNEQLIARAETAKAVIKAAEIVLKSSTPDQVEKIAAKAKENLNKLAVTKPPSGKQPAPNPPSPNPTRRKPKGNGPT